MNLKYMIVDKVDNLVEEEPIKNQLVEILSHLPKTVPKLCFSITKETKDLEFLEISEKYEYFKKSTLNNVKN